MKAPAQTTDVVATISEFVELQSNLIVAFCKTYSPINDRRYLLNVPRSGNLLVEGEEWSFTRHGVGICFTGQTSGKVVDVHEGMLEYPKAFDAWRLTQYLESIGVEKINYFSQDYDVSDEDSIKSLLNCLLQNDLIMNNSQGKVYIFK